MKKIICLIGCLSILLCACSSPAPSSATDDNVPASTASEPSQPTSEPEPANEAPSQTADGIVYTITKVELKDVVGDRDADNYSVENGDYFAMGSDLVKSSDWKEIVVSYAIDNTTDAAFGYATIMWEGRLSDGYVVKFDSNLMDFDLMQVPSNGQKEVQVSAYIESSIAVSELQLTYHHLDYSEQFFTDFGKVMAGEMGQKEYESKYTPTDLEFTVPVPFN